jgi:hypothetical protein
VQLNYGIRWSAPVVIGKGACIQNQKATVGWLFKIFVWSFGFSFGSDSWFFRIGSLWFFWIALVFFGLLVFGFSVGPLDFVTL